MNDRILESNASFESLFFLRDNLSLAERFLLGKAFDLLVHRVDKPILLLLLLLEVGGGLLSMVGGAPGGNDLAFHRFVVLLDLLEGAAHLVELFLGLQDFLEHIVSFLLLFHELLLILLVLSLDLLAFLVDSIIVVVNALKLLLHLGQTMLEAVHLLTSLRTLLFDLALDLFFLL